jgi:N6-adenosine-specific RNA methylase IME4
VSQLEIIKPSLESYNLAETAVTEELKGEESNVTLKDAWINLGNQLEIEGVPKEQISTVAQKLILEKKSEKTGS